ncbi:MAG: hypothetical protein ABJE95_31750 [Byssovorax sp.]
MGIVVFLVAVLLIPALVYCAHDTSRLIWGRLQDDAPRGRITAYRTHPDDRDGPTRRWIEGNPPWIIRIAAFTSFCLGQMIIPAVPGAIFFIVLSISRTLEGPVDPGLIGIGLSMPSAIMVALRVLGAGIGLLQRGPHAASQARGAARWELCHNLGLCVFLLGYEILGRPSGDEESGAFFLFVVALVAMLHSGLLFAAANALDAYDVSAEAGDRGAVTT